MYGSAYGRNRWRSACPSGVGRADATVNHHLREDPDRAAAVVMRLRRPRRAGVPPPAAARRPTREGPKRTGGAMSSPNSSGPTNQPTFSPRLAARGGACCRRRLTHLSLDACGPQPRAAAMSPGGYPSPVQTGLGPSRPSDPISSGRGSRAPSNNPAQWIELRMLPRHPALAARRRLARRNPIAASLTPYRRAKRLIENPPASARTRSAGMSSSAANMFAFRSFCQL